MARKKQSELSPRPVLAEGRIEILSVDLAELAQRESEAFAKDFPELANESPRFPDLESAEVRIRDALSREVIPLRSGEVPDDIDQREIDQEIAKKALMALRVGDLKALVAGFGQIPLGNAEELATKIGRLTGWDDQVIAQLILANEPERATSRALTSRIYPLREKVELVSAFSRLENAAGQYIRVGVARWFVFSRISEPTPGVVEIFGFHHGYKAKVDALATSASIGSISEKTEVLIRIGRAKAFEVISSTAYASNGAAIALQWMLGIPLLGYVPQAGINGGHRAGHLHPMSEFVLDIVRNRFGKIGFEEINPTVAKFGLVEEEHDSRPAGPVLEAVQFEGQHLIDSVEACRHLMTYGRPLKDISFEAVFTNVEEYIHAAVTMRLRVEKDHVVVATSVGPNRDSDVLSHRDAVACVLEEMEDGHDDPQALTELEAEMTRIAAQDRQSDQASIFTN